MSEDFSGSSASHQPHNEILTRALSDTSIPEIHFNGFINGVGTGDVVILLLRHGRPVAKLAASYTVAKTLAELLGQTIVNFEHQTGHRNDSDHCRTLVAHGTVTNGKAYHG
jgi:hypothetical protein